MIHAGLHQFLLVGSPTPVEAGTPDSFTITAQDQYGNTDTAFSGGVNLSTTDTNPSSSVPGSATLTSGVDTFAATFDQAGSQTISATSGLSTGTSNTVTVTPASLSHFAVTEVPVSTTAGVSFMFTVTAQDAFDNTVTGFSGSVGFSSTDSNSANHAARRKSADERRRQLHRRADQGGEPNDYRR